ncbi:hypothetical protein QE152_g41536, partial [Popillia japonica]|jgi:hypothetical protein
VIR